MGWLYMIHFGDKSRFYIGATTMRLSMRRANHIKALVRGRSGPLLQAEFDRCGRDAFTFVPLREYEGELLHRREAEMILKLQPALNVIRRYAPLAAKVGVHPTTLKRRFEAGVDIRTVAKRVTLRPRKPPAEYKVQKYNVGSGATMSAKEIIAASGASKGIIYRRIKDGVRGPALLAQTVRGRPTKPG